MRRSVASQGKGMIRAYGYTPINSTGCSVRLEVADQPKMPLHDRHHRRGYRPQRRARSAGCVITMQRQRLLMNGELLLTVEAIEIARRAQAVEHGLAL